MSTPQTLTQALPPHQHLDHRQRYLPSPQERYLPPPRPSSNLSSSFHNNIPARPASNLSNHPIAPPPPRTQSGMSNSGYAHGHSTSQSRAGADYAYANGLTRQISTEELRRTDSRASQHQRPQIPHQTPQALQASRAPIPATSQMPPYQFDGAEGSETAEQRRRRKEKSNVDWVAYFGGKPPPEIITIHDDDSPAPPERVPLPPPATQASAGAPHVDKKRRMNHAEAGDVTLYSANNTPHTYSNGASTESLQNTTAPTSLGSQVSNDGRYDGAQTGQKRKRTTRTSEQERKKQETERSGPRGYLAEYGEYVPPLRLPKKQKDVVVATVHDVCLIKIAKSEYRRVWADCDCI